jgi:hypothetical protein
MLKMLAVIVALVAAVFVLRFASRTQTVGRAYASPAAATQTVPAVSFPSNEAELQRFGQADGTVALPGQIEAVLVGSPQPAEANARQAHPKKVLAKH